MVNVYEYSQTFTYVSMSHILNELQYKLHSVRELH